MSEPLYFDGDFLKASQHGPVIEWMDNETRSLLFKIRYMQLAEKYAALPIGTAGPKGSFLVSQSEPSDTGVAAVVEFERVYAQKPKSRREAEDDAYVLQQVIDGDIAELPLHTNHRVVYDYFHTSDPDSITLTKAYKLVKVGNGIYQIGTAPGGGDTWILSDDMTLRRWRGNFWERKSRYINRSTLTLT